MQGRFSLLILTLKILILFPIPSPSSPSQIPIPPLYFSQKYKNGREIENKLQKYFSNVYEEKCGERNRDLL
jgi:hypothetical protein